MYRIQKQNFSLNCVVLKYLVYIIDWIQNSSKYLFKKIIYFTREKSLFLKFPYYNLQHVNLIPKINFRTLS